MLNTYLSYNFKFIYKKKKYKRSYLKKLRIKYSNLKL